MTASPTPAPPDPLTDALNASYAAVFAYGVVGAHVAEAQRGYALQALAGHRASRDWLRERITDAGGKPPPAAAAYATGPVNDAAQASALAVQVELALVPRWSAAAGVLPAPDRPYCASQAQGSAVRALVWGGAPQAFPGSAAAPAPASTEPAGPSPSQTQSNSPSTSAPEAETVIR